ncbi:hypothetical protein OG410_39390 [Streptomyces sp. NBC_00659]|nr:hypothetical protein [Streptomyces sp. NBC_00659]
MAVNATAPPTVDGFGDDAKVVADADLITVPTVTATGSPSVGAVVRTALVAVSITDTESEPLRGGRMDEKSGQSYSASQRAA